MNLQLIRAHTLPDARQLERVEGDTLVAPVGAKLDARPGAAPVHLLVDAAGVENEGSCAAADGEAARHEERVLACPHHEAEAAVLDERVREPVRLGADGVLLELPDAWYAAGARAAGFCEACDARLNDHLQQRLGEQYVAYDVVSKLAADERAPFWRDHGWQRLSSGIEHGARLSRRIRDEARLAGKETRVGARLTGFTPAGVRLARKLDYVVLPAPVPAVERVDCGAYEVYRAALSARPVVGLLDDDTASSPAATVQAWRLATAVGAAVSLPPDAPEESHDALARHRRFLREFRSRYRPVERAAEVLLVYSPECDHWTNGRHGAGVRAAAEALTRVSAQYRVVLTIPRTGSEPLVLADAGALPHEQARRLSQRVKDGASAIFVGQPGAADELGRPFESPFGELSEGLGSLGSGSVFSVDPAGTPDSRAAEPLVVPMDRALDALLGRGRRLASVNRKTLVVKAFLDPDKKLDVHLVGRAWNPAASSAEAVQGTVLRLSGALVGGARTGWLFSPGVPERKVALSPFDMGVQATLPDFIGSAVLTVSR